MPDEKITVLIVDDQAVFHELIARLLAPHDDIEVAGVASTVEEALAIAAVAQPDVVIMDQVLPDGKGTDAARRIMSQHRSTRVLMLTSTADDKTVRAARKAKCSGYVTKDRISQDLVTAVRGAYRGETTVPNDSLGLFGPLYEAGGDL